MSEYVVTNKTISAIGIVVVIALVAVGFISYNFGMSNGLGRINNNLNVPVNDETTNTKPVGDETLNDNDIASSTPQEITVSGEPVQFEGKNILNGTVGQVSPTGFSFNVTVETLNTATKTFGQKVTNYTVTVNSATKIVEMTNMVTIPPEGGTPTIKTTSKNIKLADLSPEEQVTVFTNSETSAKTLLATEVRVTKNIRN